MRGIVVTTAHTIGRTRLLSHDGGSNFFHRNRRRQCDGAGRWKYDGDRSSSSSSSSNNNNNKNDWTTKISQSMEDAVRRASEKASERIISSSQQAWKSSRDFVESQTEQLVKQASETSQDLARKALERAAASSQEAIQASKEYVNSTVKSASDQISKTITKANPITASQRLAKAASDKALSMGQKAARQATETVTESVKDATEKATASIKSRMKELSFSLQQFLRSALWWGLGAIFVYGIATTLPVEIFRYLTRQQPDDKKTDDPQKAA